MLSSILCKMGLAILTLAHIWWEVRSPVVTKPMKYRPAGIPQINESSVWTTCSFLGNCRSPREQACSTGFVANFSTICTRPELTVGKVQVQSYYIDGEFCRQFNLGASRLAQNAPEAPRSQNRIDHETITETPYRSRQPYR